MNRSSHRSRGWRRWAAMAVAAATVAAACGDDSSDDDDSDEAAETDDGQADAPGGTTDDDTAPDPDEFEQPEGEPNRDATFIYGYPIGASRLDPHQASISQDGTTLFPAYDRVVHLAPDGELIPGLAESWEFSDDAETLTLNVRPGVTFHDGAELDAEAVKVNLERAIGLEGSSVATDLSSVESVEVVDPMTVQLNLSTPDVSVAGALSDRAGILVSPDALADEVDLDANMVGAGPYRMVDHVPDDTTVFERNDDYWDTENVPDVARLEIRVLPDAASRLNAVRTDQIHATTVTPDEVRAIENDPDVRLMIATELQYIYVVQNRARAGQDDLQLRQALLHGLDREAICDGVLDGLCVVTDQPFPPGYAAYNDEIDQVLYPYDPDRAQELMDEAGVSDLELSMLIPGGLPTYPEVAQVIQAQWAELGVTVEIEPTVPQSLGQVMFAEERGDTMLAAWGGRPDPAMTLDQRAGPDSFANPGGHSTDEMAELISQAKATVDPDERDAILQAGSQEMAESVLEMVIYFPQVPHITRPDVVFTPYLTAKPEFRDIAIVQ